MKPKQTIWILGLAGMMLAASGVEAKRLTTCISHAYRYANARGVSLPALDIPSPEDVSDAAPSARAQGSGVGSQVPSAGPQNRPGAPVARPPHRGSMVLPRGAQAYRSC